MFKKRRLIGLLLTLALIAAFMLSACGGDDKKEDKKTATPTTVVTEVVTEAAPVATEVVTEVAPTATEVPPTATKVPPTATEVPPTATKVPPTATEVPPTATKVPPTATKVPPTATKVVAVAVATEAVAAATEELATPEPIAIPDLIDCTKYDLSGLKIGLVTDVGQINDKSFNQSSWQGVLAAEPCGASVDYIETQDATDYANNIAEFAESDYNVIVTVGYALGPATIEAAKTYPDIKFIGVDQFQAEVVPNVAGLIFHEDYSGYLAGVLAARLTKTNVIAAVLGTDQVPPVVAFKEGYEAGARAVNPDIQLISTYHPGAIDVAFLDPEWGAATAKQALDQGADVVFAAGGKTGNGGLQEVANAVGAGSPPPWCIGVDTDQWETVPEAHPCLVSSAMKLLDKGVSDLIMSVADDKWTPGNFFGDAALASFHDFEDAVPADVKADLVTIAAGLKDGSISTGYGVAPAEEPAATEAAPVATEEVAMVPAATEELATPEPIAIPDLIDCTKYDLSGLKIGLVTDVGQINDKSFNQSSWQGVLAAEPCGASVDYIETQDATDYANNIAEFAESDYNVIVTVGYALGPATIEAAKTYPDIKFIGVDQFQAEVVPNVTGLIFHEDYSGYLAGVLAARLTKTNVIAAVLGTDQVPPVVAFKEGYEAGARAVNPDIQIISTYHPGAIDVAFLDPEWGAATAKQALDQGADVVFAAGGKTGNGGLQEVANAVGAGSPPPWCIGVDTDQWETVPEAHPCLVSSAMKLLDKGVSDLIMSVADDKWTPGNFFGDAALASFHDFEDAVPADVKADLVTIAAGLKDGSISTGYGVAPAEEPAATEAAPVATGDLGVIKVGINAEYPPFEYVDENKDIVGFDPDLMNAIATKAGFDIEFVNTRWDGIFVALQSGEFDAVSSAATITAEREEIVDFSNPYFNAGQTIAVKAENADKIKTPADLAGRRVGVQAGTTGDIASSEMQGVEVVRYDEITLAFQALNSGDIDAIVNDGPTSADIISKNPDMGIVIVGDPFTDEFYGIAVNPDKPELLDAINKGLAEVIADGTYAEIYKKWIGVEPPSAFRPK